MESPRRRWVSNKQTGRKHPGRVVAPPEPGTRKREQGEPGGHVVKHPAPEPRPGDIAPRTGTPPRRGWRGAGLEGYRGTQHNPRRGGGVGWTGGCCVPVLSDDVAPFPVAGEKAKPPPAPDTKPPRGIFPGGIRRGGVFSPPLFR